VLVLASVLSVVAGPRPAPLSAQGTTPTSRDDGVPTGVGPAAVPAVEAPMPFPPEGTEPPPELDLAGLEVAGALPPPDGSPVPVRVSFRAPVSLPDAGYRLSVLVGDPRGSRTRVSLVMDAGTPAGVVETGNGLTWTTTGTTPVEVDDDAVVLTVPPGTAAPDAAVWAEAVSGTDLAAATIRSPAFSWAALAGRSSDGALVAGRWGWTTTAGGQAFFDPVSVPGRPARLTVLNGALIVEFPDPVPEALEGQPVVDAVAYVRVGEGVDARHSDHLLINRISGVVRLFDDVEGLPVEVGQEAAWLGPGLPADDRGGPGSVSVDLGELGRVLGVPVEPGTFRVRADQVFMLGDRRMVTVSGVAATLAWFEAAVSGSGPSNTATPGAVAEASGVGSAEGIDWRPVLVGGGAGVVLVLLVGVPLALARRRRRRRREAELAEAARSSGPLLRVGPTPAPAASHGRLPPAPGTGAASVADRGMRATGPEPAASPGEGGAGPRGGRGGRSRSPEEVLAAFEADLGDLLERVDRLGSPGDAQGEHRDGR
jgi:hypothetical protein